MTQSAESVTLSVPRAVLSNIMELSDELTDRMHQLLERNTDGALGPSEKAELETLVQIAEFGQIISVALHKQVSP